VCGPWLLTLLPPLFSKTLGQEMTQASRFGRVCPPVKWLDSLFFFLPFFFASGRNWPNYPCRPSAPQTLVTLFFFFPPFSFPLLDTVRDMKGIGILSDDLVLDLIPD